MNKLIVSQQGYLRCSDSDLTEGTTGTGRAAGNHAVQKYLNRGQSTELRIHCTRFGDRTQLHRAKEVPCALFEHAAS